MTTRKGVTKSRGTRSRGCGTKNQYTDKQKAYRHMRELIARGAYPYTMNVYPCKHIKHGEPVHWHVGHRPGAQGKR